MNTPVDNPKRVVWRRDDDDPHSITVGSMTNALDAVMDRKTCDDCGTWDYDSLAPFWTDMGDYLWMKVLCPSCHPDNTPLI